MFRRRSRRPPPPAPPPPAPPSPPTPGSVDSDRDGYDDAHDCGPTNAAIHPGAPNVPDLKCVDSNCDGIDGTELNAIFVSPNGNDANSGTKAQLLGPSERSAYGIGAINGASLLPTVSSARPAATGRRRLEPDLGCEERQGWDRRHPRRARLRRERGHEPRRRRRRDVGRQQRRFRPGRRPRQRRRRRGR
jgi:hypothetical protein